MVIKIQNMSFVLFSSFLILFDIFYIVQIAMTWDLRQFLTRKWKMSSVYAFIIAWQKWNMWTRNKIKTTTKCYRKIGLCQKSFLVIVIMQHLFFCFRLHFRSASYKEIRGKIETTNFDMKNGPFGNNDLYAITLAS